MKKIHVDALSFGYMTKDIEKMKTYHFGENIKIDRKLHELYLEEEEEEEDKDTDEEEIFVLALMPNHLIAPFGKILPQRDIEEAKDNFLALAPSYDLLPLYKAWSMLKHNDYHSFIILDGGKRKTKRRGVKQSILKYKELDKYTL